VLFIIRGLFAYAHWHIHYDFILWLYRGSPWIL